MPDRALKKMCNLVSKEDKVTYFCCSTIKDCAKARVRSLMCSKLAIGAVSFIQLRMRGHILPATMASPLQVNESITTLFAQTAIILGPGYWYGRQHNFSTTSEIDQVNISANVLPTLPTKGKFTPEKNYFARIFCPASFIHFSASLSRRCWSLR